MAWLKRLRQRLARVQTGNRVVDGCCHLVGGEWRAGPPKEKR